MQRSLAFNEIQSNLNNHIANIKSTPEKFASFNPETISVANDPVAIKAARAEINGEFKVEADGTVVFNDDSIESAFPTSTTEGILEYILGQSSTNDTISYILPIYVVCIHLGRK